MIRIPTYEIGFGGVRLPAKTWSVNQAGYGSMSSCSIETSKTMLGEFGIRLKDITSDHEGRVPLDIWAGFGNENDEDHNFGGWADGIEFDPFEDKVVITGVDVGVDLLDASETLSTYNYRNATISELARQIAERYGLDPVFVQDSDLRAASAIGDETTFMPEPQNPWSLLLSMATLAGWEVIVTPDGELFFGDPTEDRQDFRVQAGFTPEDEAEFGGNTTDWNPLVKLHISHQPRKNRDFIVKVLSYNPQAPMTRPPDGQARNRPVSRRVGGRVVTAGVLVATSGGRTTRTNISRGGLGGRNSANNRKPTLTFRFDGLTAEQAQRKAEEIAKDIAKREVIVTGIIEGQGQLLIHDRVTIEPAYGYDLQGYEDDSYTAVNVSHSYDGSNGYKTEFKALSIPEGVVGQEGGF